MVCFLRSDILENQTAETADESIADQEGIDVPFPIEKFPYKLLFSKEFPFNQDARSVEEKIMDDVRYFINRHLTVDDPYFNEEKNICEIPLANILPFVHDSADLNELRTIVQKEFLINEQDCIEHKLIESSDFEDDEYDEVDDNDAGDHDNDNDEKAQNQQHSCKDDESWD